MAKQTNSSCGAAPEEMSVHMLIGDIAKHTEDALSCESSKQGLAPGCRDIMLHLALREGVTQLELSRLTGLKPPTISVSLRKMEGDGLVNRTSDKDDLRRTIVTLTDRGREILSHVTSVFCGFDAAIKSALDSAELDTLKALLLKVRKSIISESEEEAQI